MEGVEQQQRSKGAKGTGAPKLGHGPHTETDTKTRAVYYPHARDYDFAPPIFRPNQNGNSTPLSALDGLIGFALNGVPLMAGHFEKGEEPTEGRIHPSCNK